MEEWKNISRAFTRPWWRRNNVRKLLITGHHDYCPLIQVTKKGGFRSLQAQN